MSQARPISRRALLFGRSDGESPVSPPRTGRAGSSQARSAQTLRPPWALRGAAFANACTGCVACVDACPEQVLVLRKGKAVFEPERGECTFCHACVDACAPGALRDDGVQPPWSYRANVDEEILGDLLDELGAAEPEDRLVKGDVGVGIVVDVLPAGIVSV